MPHRSSVTIIAIVPQASGHGARPVPVSEWVHLYSISSCTIQPSFLSLVFNHTTSAFDPVLHLRVRATMNRSRPIYYAALSLFLDFKLHPTTLSHYFIVPLYRTTLSSYFITID